MKLGEVCLSITDGKHGDCKNCPGSGYYFISAKDINNRNIDYSDAREIEEDDFIETNKRTRLEPGDILLTNSGTIGRLAIARDDKRTSRTTFQKSVAILKPNPLKVCSEFLYYYFAFKKEEIVELAGGTTQQNLLLGDLRSYEVSLPPLPEQRAIADVLSALDDKIELNCQISMTLEEIINTIFKNWFLDTKKEYCKEIQMKDILSPINERINNLVAPEYSATITGLSLRDEKFKKKLSKSSDHNKKITKGNLVFGLSRQTINFGVMKDSIGSVSSVYEIFSINESIVKPDLLEKLIRFRMNEFLDILKPSAREGQTIERNYLLTKKIGIPDNDLQSKFENLCFPLHLLIDNLSKESQTLTALRDTLLPKLMSGQVRVN